MGRLVSLLEQAGRARGLLAENESLTPELTFSLVRDLPYQRASSRKPEAVIQEWRGTCSGKHYLLADIFRELGLESQVVMCTHYFTPDNTRLFPQELRRLVTIDPVPDVHTYLRVNAGRGWTVVDATWPSKAEPLGMTVNHFFTPGSDMTLACEPIETVPVPAGRDPQEFKEQLIDRFCGARSGHRDDFIEGLGRWLASSA